MIDLQDFEQEYNEAREAVEQHIHRAEKGIPSDRWLDGRVGHVALVRAEKALLQFIDFQAEVMARMYKDIQQRGDDSTEPFKDPMR